MNVKTLFTMQSKSNKVLRDKFLTKIDQDLYTENCKTLLKEMKYLNKWKNILKFMVERFKILRVAIVLKLTYRLHAIIVKIHARFLGFLFLFVLQKLTS